MVLTMLSGKESRQAAGDVSSIAAYIDQFEAEKTGEFGSQFAFSPDERQAIIDAATNKDRYPAYRDSPEPVKLRYSSV